MSKTSNKRLGKEAVMINRDAPPFCFARPREDNILEWHYILRGPPGTDYAGGEYWGTLTFPSDYPFKPPGIKMTTPSGRFKPDTKICMSMSDFHPGSWNPAWSVSTILTGMLSFMVSEHKDEATTTGSIETTPEQRQQFAARSHAWNIGQKKFVQIFPEYAGAETRDLPNMGEIRKPKEVEDAEKAAAEEDKRKNGGASTSQVRTATERTTPTSAKPPADKTQVTLPPRAGLSSSSTAAGKTTVAASRASAQAVAPAAPQGPMSMASKLALAAIVLGLFLARLFSGSS